MSRKSNLGAGLEELINWSCRQYAAMGLANIQKVPTPFKIIGQDPRRHCLMVVPDEQSTVDYIGEYQGRPFAMEAKKTENTTRYPLDPWDREQHQREFLQRWNGLKFYLIAFWKLNEFYLLPFDAYQQWHQQAQEGGRKSIPISWFRENASMIREGGRVVLDFLDAV